MHNDLPTGICLGIPSIWWWGASYEDLGCVDEPFIASALSCTLIRYYSIC